ncbi:hypothetical protein M3Y96_00494100 [Aphelenchoides besseyi]|nr:hypothetical protein M3Y96_00494100 [Aphelenchoides besseyi]
MVPLKEPLHCAQFDRRKAVGPCVRGGKCPPGHVCHQKECYPAPVAQMDDPMNDMFDDAKPRRLRNKRLSVQSFQNAQPSARVSTISVRRVSRAIKRTTNAIEHCEIVHLTYSFQTLLFVLSTFYLTLLFKL